MKKLHPLLINKLNSQRPELVQSLLTLMANANDKKRRKISKKRKKGHNQSQLSS